MSLEVFYHAVKNDIKSKYHAVLAAIHFSLISKGFKYFQSGGKFPLSDMPPENWAQENKCSMTYQNSAEGACVMLKVFDMKMYALAHLVREGCSSITDLDVPYDSYIGENFTTFSGTYNNPEELLKLIDSKLISPATTLGTTVRRSEPNASSPRDAFDPLERERSRGTSLPSDRCPFCQGNSRLDEESIIRPSGRCDLDPLGRGCTCGRGGGMFFDPLRNFTPPGRPRPDDPSLIPPGSVPPGARFDPIGPAATPRRSHPDPDEMQPPGSREHYF